MAISEKASHLKNCFISAPAGAKIEALRDEIESRGLQVIVPQCLSVGTDWASEILKNLSTTDLVIGVLTSEKDSPWVLFELGQAFALGRRIVLIMSPTMDPIPLSSLHFLVLRIDLDNVDAIQFALDQIISAPAPKRESAKDSRVFQGLGEKVYELKERLKSALKDRDSRAVEEIVSYALRHSGTDVVVSGDRDYGADFAVWSDVLEPFVGNPLLVEVKMKMNSVGEAKYAVQQLTSYIEASGSRWALLLYGEGPAPELLLSTDGSANILALPLWSFLDMLTSKGFPELIRDLRNRRVHGTTV